VSELDPLDKRLGMAWQALSPPAELAGRVRARLSSASGAAPAATLGGRVASRWRALRASGPLGASLGALLLGVGIALGYLIPREPLDAARAPEEGSPSDALPSSALPSSALPIGAALAGTAGDAAPSRPTPAPERSAAARSTATLGDETSPSGPGPDPGARSRRAPGPAARARAHLSAPPRSTNDGAELLLLERAERAVRAKNPALALALIAELEQQYPRSPLHEERRSIELMAHCQAGAGAEPAARLERFLRQYPESVYFARIAAECNDARSVAPLTNSAAPDIDGAEGGDDVQ
jgi:hypothetical protein